MILLIDNYDSFTFNLAQYFQTLGETVKVYKNDELSINDVKNIRPDHIVLSPGPNKPDDAGISINIIHEFHQHLPILGVCLGHQCLAQAFGGKVIPAEKIIHGKATPVTHTGLRLFQGMPTPFQAGRYHSLIVDKSHLPGCFIIDAQSDHEMMAISHRHLPLYGLQFHPESILTEHGMVLLKNFIQQR